MTTITALNVRLAMDVSNFSQGADLAKGEVTKVTAIMRQSVPAAEKYKQEVDLLNRTFSEAGKQSKQYANALDFLAQKHKQGKYAADDMTKSVDKSNVAMKQTQSSANTALAAIGGMAAAYVSFQTVSKSIDLASNIEDATIAFETLTGSAKDGQLLFEQIRQFDKQTPITFGNATQAAKTMLSFGVAVQDVQKNLRMLSDVTGGNNERFKMLALAFSQSSAGGRLMGQDLLQMINAGFNPLQQISKTTGESMLDLKKRMEDGGISTDEVRKAFEDATSEGGMFHGMTERLSETVSGKLNIALSDLEQKLAAAGQAMGPLIVQLLDVFTKLKPLMDLVVGVIGKISDGLAYMLAVATDVVNTITTMTLDRTETDKFLDMLDERQRAAALAKEQAQNKEFENRKAAENQALVAAKKAADEAAAAKAKAKAAQQKAMKEAWEQQQKLIEKEKQSRLKAIEEAKRAQERAAKEAEDKFQRDLETARQAAVAYFKEREEKIRQRREAVAAGPGAGMEVGSAEAAKFAADTVNRRIGAAAVPEKPSPGEQEIVNKADQLFRQQKEANEKHERQIALLDGLLREAKDNGFRRLR